MGALNRLRLMMSQSASVTKIMIPITGPTQSKFAAVTGTSGGNGKNMAMKM